MGQFIAVILDLVNRMGYLGVVAAMFLESSFFPFPSEVVIPPAGTSQAKGRCSSG